MIVYLWFENGLYWVWDGVAGESFTSLTDAANYLVAVSS